MTLILLISAVMALLTFFMVLFFLAYVRRKRGTDIFHRLRRHHVVDTKKESETEDLLVMLYRFVKRTAKPMLNWQIAQRLDLKLKQAGIPLFGAEFIVCAVVGALLVGTIIYMLTLNHIFAIAFGLLVPVALWVGILFLIRRRRNAFTEQLGDCLTTVSNALRAGYSFQQAMEVIAKEMEPPISDEFAHITTDLAMGITLENALEQMNKRVDSADLDLVVTAVLIQREVGGNLAQILDSISDTIMERIRMKREIMALTAQGRFSALVLTSLPFVTAGIMYMLSPKQIMMLFENPTGRMALVFSVVMMIIGFIVIQRIVDIDS